MAIDIDREDYYAYGKDKARTRSRLERISACGAVEVQPHHFGVPGVVSGLYIEKVWAMDDEEFKDYMDWFESRIK